MMLAQDAMCPLGLDTCNWHVAEQRIYSEVSASPNICRQCSCSSARRRRRAAERTRYCMARRSRTGRSLISWRRTAPTRWCSSLPLESLMDDHVIEALNRHFGKKMESLTHQQVMALALAYSEEEITNERLQHVLDMHRADITDMLSKMCSMQLLESSGYGRGKKYHVYGIEVTTFDGKVATSGRKVATSGGKVATSDGKAATSGRKVATSDGKVATLKKRYSKEELRKMILDVCRDWRTIEEISYTIERDPVYLRNKVIPQMSDLLERMYENIPHHPRQKYRARQRETD